MSAITPAPTAASPPSARWLQTYWPALWLAVILALVAVVRIHLRSLPLERDEGEYAYAGQLMLEGEPPYQLAYNMKMPGIYAAYALIMAVFGQTDAGIRMGFTLVTCGAIVLLYFVGCRFLSREGAVAACAAYALLSLSPHVQGLNAHATHFVVLAALAGTLVLLRAQERGRLGGYFWSGTLFGLAFLLKQPGGAFGFFGAAIIVWAAARREMTDWRTEGRRILLYCAGVAAPIILTGLILWRAGVWDKFWWWTVTYARTHATARTWSDGRVLLGRFFAQLSWDAVFWWLALAGLVAVLFGKRRAEEKFFLLSLLLFSTAAVVPTLSFTDHYFVLMLPVVAILSAEAFTMLAGIRGRWIFFAVAWICAARPWLGSFLTLPAERIAEGLYVSNRFQVYPVIADYLKAHSAPRATIAVLGSEPELMFYARRRSATGYIYMYDLVQAQPFREKMEKEMVSEVENCRPDYVVFVNLALSWLPQPPECLDEIRSWFMPYTDNNYDPFGVVTFPSNQYFWGKDCLTKISPGNRFVIIFERKPKT